MEWDLMVEDMVCHLSKDGEEDFVMRCGVVVSYSSLNMFTKSCLGGMMVSLIFLEGLQEEAWVESMEVKEKDEEEDFVMRCGVVVSYSSLDMFTKSYLGGMMVSLIFLEGLEEEAWVESMEVEEK
nr:hypothetical protein [Tanacetum cinerariifolium]